MCEKNKIFMSVRLWWGVWMGFWLQPSWSNVPYIQLTLCIAHIIKVSVCVWGLQSSLIFQLMTIHFKEITQTVPICVASLLLLKHCVCLSMHVCHVCVCVCVYVCMHGKKYMCLYVFESKHQRKTAADVAGLLNTHTHTHTLRVQEQ